MCTVFTLLFAVQDGWAQQKKKKAKLPPTDLSGAYLANAQYNFNTSGLQNVVLSNPTSLQFGPDSRLYVSQQDGVIKALTIKRNGANSYSVTATETIGLINQIPNYNDDGTLNTSVTKRQVTGILVTGTAAQPILYVSSSDSRIGGGSSAGDKNLDTNSGIVSRLTRTSSGWTKIDLVRGLPRSEENHSVNGMQLDEQSNKLFLAVGGSTNAGSPSNNFAFTCEYALSAAILSIDLTAIDAMPTQGSGNTAYKYNLPTLDDPTRTNNPDGSDVNDPFGGNDGLNQAKIVAGGPVQIFSPGYRNAYDLVITKTPGKARRMYSIDNGANAGWGGYPENEGSDGRVTNNYVSGEPGSTGPGQNDPKVNNLDNLHFIGDLSTYVPGSHYAGHPTPTRANPSGAGLYTHDGVSGFWRTSKTGTSPLPADWPPLPLSMANPIEGNFQNPGETDLALLTFENSTNGMTEYTASNFNDALKGTLLAADFGGNIHKITLTEDGSDVTNPRSSTNKLTQDLPFASGFGSQPLDVVAQGDNDIFPGSVWAATYGSDVITIFEPADFVSCTGTYSTSLDDDLDGYSNADEIDNATNPCSASSMPQDFDRDLLSDLNDSDDDNDQLGDNIDLFALDPQNGLATNLPIRYDLFNNDPGTGLFGLGFTGLMSNKKPDNDYYNLYDEGNLIAGGAVGAFSVVAVSAGDALGSLNNQENAFQFGVNVNASTGPFTVHTSMFGPFFNNKAPQNFQSQGLYIGTGDQDNYLKVVLNANGGAGGIEVVYENGGQPTSFQYELNGGIPASTLDLYLSVNPSAGTVQAKYARDGGPVTNVGSPIQVSGALLTVLQGSPALAVGIIATSRESSPFTATWDIINVTADPVTSVGSWETIAPASGTPTSRHENAFVQAGDKFYLLGGRGTKPVQAYDPVNKTWTNKANTPIEMNHFQAVTIDGLIYVVGAFTGGYPHETPIPKIYIYNPLTDKWLDGPAIPEARRRGSAGVVVRNKKIYLISGITDGHYAGHVKWFDEFDPATNSWKTLPDAPRARDHSHAALINNKLYLAGGRRSSYATGETYSLTVPEVDVYDFETSTWSTLPSSSNIPTPRAGASTAVLGDEVVVIGGESVSQSGAHKETEALNVSKNTWRRLADLQTGRHGTQAIVNNNSIYVMAGSGSMGGSPELNSQERFYMFAPTTPTGNALTQSLLSAPGEVKYGAIAVNTSSTKLVAITNTGTNQSIVLSSIGITGSAAFTYTSPYALPIVIPVGGSINLSVTFKPTATGSQTATMTLTHSGSGGSTTVALSGGEPGTAIRINSGGPQMIAFDNTFAADKLFSGGNVYTNTAASIEGTEYDALYQSERSSSVDLGSFDYNIPVAAGQYLVKLHFAEIYYGATGGGAYGIGKRVFNVTAEGNPIPGLTNYDILADVGVMTAVVKEVLVDVQDGTLNLNFKGVVNRPKVSAVEVIAQTVTNGVLAANPTSLHFFSQQAGTTSAPQTITLTNSGTTSIQVNSVSLTGANNAEFSHNFTNPVTVNAGGSTSIGVTFKPSSLGTKVAQLSITHTGTNSPLSVGLTGEGINNNPTPSTALYRINSGGGQASTSIGTFAADAYFSPDPGSTFSKTSAIAGTTDDIIYQSERSTTSNTATLTYNFPVGNGQYTVVLHFAEIYWTAIGQRVFDVSLEGVKVLDNYDIVKKVGALTATTEVLQTSVTDGMLTLVFSALPGEGGVNRPKISAIEVLGTIDGSNQLPVANAGADKTITLPVNSVQLNGSGTDADGTISAYAWSQISGPNTATFSSTTAAQPTVSGLVQGSYTFALTVTDEKAAASTPDQVTVTVNPATTVNQAPVANAGPDQTVTAGAGNLATVQLNGSASTDADGTIVSYVWKEGTSQLATGATASVSLAVGVHTLTLAVTDNQGASAEDQVVVTVNSATAPSTALYRINSGGGQASTSIGTFAADAYFSPDPGSTFSKTSAIAGTTDDIIYQSERSTTSNTATLTYNFPVGNGQYTVVLHFAEIYWTAIGQRVFDVSLEGVKVLDNYDIVKKVGALTATTEVLQTSVTDGMLTLVFSALPGEGGVNRPKISAIEVLGTIDGSNQLPVANAGADKTITLPVNSVQLNGSGTDADGTISAYAWSQISGPNTATFSSTTAAQPTVSGLVQGSYTFALTVTDEKAAASTPDQVTVTVNPATTVNQAPVANAGPDQTVTAGAGNLATVQLNGSASTDADGTIVSYVWKEGTSQLATGATASVSLAVGVHTLTLAVTDNQGASAEDQVVVTVNSATATNQAPVANAGPDKTITLPTNSTQLNGSGTDADGAIASYAWSQISGPSTATFSSTTAAQPTVSGLLQGSYTFALVVTDDKGTVSAPDQVNVTVNPAPVSNQQVVSYSLINANTDLEIQTITAGAVLNLATLPTRNLNIRVNTSPTVVGSVIISLTGAQVLNVKENKAPYSVFGDTNGNYKAWTPKTGNYTLMATPYTASGGGGTAGTSLTIGFSVIDQPAASQVLANGESINAVIKENKLMVYPNPNKGDMLNLELNDFGPQEEVMITLHDMTGRLIQTHRIKTDESGIFKYELNLMNQLNKGTYIVRAKSKTTQASTQLIIQ
ncbi:PKD domain-containing protein [Pontibacter deserti]|uniref:PKD domain-containing protein n=2 Tax=Pontibacter TaxID=323449 RepID=UPI0020265D96|nr:malectin domain-containing carbohydrate-binding protein [Pontibacter deserti]